MCVCNATYCDTLDDAQLHPKDYDEVIVLTTSEVSEMQNESFHSSIINYRVILGWITVPGDQREMVR